MPTLAGTRKVPILGRAAFSPLDIAGIQLWLKADAGLWQDAAMTTPAVADTDPVGGWADQSGNANHATQATAGNRPLLKLAIQNGRPVVRFDGTDDWLGLPNAAMPVQNHTVFAVVNATSNAGSKIIIARSYNYGAFYLCVLANNHPTGPRKLRLAVNDGLLTGTANADGTPALVVGRYDSANNKIFVNGADEQTAANAAGAINYNANDGATVGVLYDSNLSLFAAYMSGDVAELLLYNSALSTANRQAVEAYLNSRWAVY